MQNHYFDDAHPLRPYTHSLPAMPGTFPPVNALRAEEAPITESGFWPCESNGVWVAVEDHRGKSGYLNGQTHEIKELGPLPEGWSDTPPPPPPPTVEEQIAAFTNAIQAHLDGFAQTRNYDGIMSAATYAASTVPKFRAEGQYAVAGRDAVWATAYAVLDEVLAGGRPMPTIEEVIAELPPLEWTE